MFRSRRRGIGSGGDIGSDRLEKVLDLVSFGKFDSNVERDPGALVLAVASLDFFVDALLDFALENTRSLGFVEADDFEDLSGIEPAIRASAHDGDIVDDAFVDWHA